MKYSDPVDYGRLNPFKRKVLEAFSSTLKNLWEKLLTPASIYVRPIIEMFKAGIYLHYISLLTGMTGGILLGRGFPSPAGLSMCLSLRFSSNRS